MFHLLAKHPRDKCRTIAQTFPLDCPVGTFFVAQEPPCSPQKALPWPSLIGSLSPFKSHDLASRAVSSAESLASSATLTPTCASRSINCWTDQPYFRLGFARRS